MQNSTQRQSGSVVVYGIVGVVLAALAVGAIVVAQHRGGVRIASQPATEAPRESGSESTTPSPSQGQSQDNKAAEQAQADKEAADKKAAEDKARQDVEAKKKADEKAAADKKAADERAAQQQTAAAATPAGPMAQTGGVQSASHLPTTGPVEDTLSMVVGLMAILGAGYFYYHYGRRRA